MGRRGQGSYTLISVAFLQKTSTDERLPSPGGQEAGRRRFLPHMCVYLPLLVWHRRHGSSAAAPTAGACSCTAGAASGSLASIGMLEAEPSPPSDVEGSMTQSRRCRCALRYERR